MNRMPEVLAGTLATVICVCAAWAAFEDDRFIGGGYDGYGNAFLLQGFPAVASARFLGGSNDGYDNAVFIQGFPAAVSARFLGGSNDGYDNAMFLQGFPAVVSARFVGGAYDGYDRGGVMGIMNPLLYDSDGDGLVDWWEAVYFHSLATLSAGGDYDLDGDDDGAEFIALTDPTDSNAYFRIMAVDATNSAAVTFVSTNARTYSLEVSTNLVAGDLWAPVPGLTNVTGDASGVMTMVDTNSTVPGFYRITVSEP